MIARKMAALVGAAMVSVAVPAQELTSEPTFVFLRPETSSFWNTATNNTMTVPIDFPSGATSASLAVSGVGFGWMAQNFGWTSVYVTMLACAIAGGLVVALMWKAPAEQPEQENS